MSRRDRKPLGLAGLWRRYSSSDDAVTGYYCVITTEANQLAASTHVSVPRLQWKTSGFGSWTCRQSVTLHWPDEDHASRARTGPRYGRAGRGDYAAGSVPQRRIWKYQR
ncbi:SOS response-associated peptidase family protein [Roseococcus pinisoli]|uniref:hypothetical protein n=1 Tax=Roseococcus pinisoli TaxID=2835040 RepID=UPI0038CF9D49